MPELDALRHSIPDEHDDFDPEAWFTNYSLTAPTIVEVESPTEANTVRAAYLNEASQAGVPRRGLYVWVDNIHQLWRDNQDGGWEVIGGRRHAATVEFSRNVIGSPSSPLVLYAQDVTDASPGFTIVGGGEGSPEGRNVVLPASGWWTMSANNVRLTGAASNVGRVFFQFSSADGGELSGRLSSGPNENHHSGSITVYQPAGAQIRVLAYHEGGGTRTWTATVNLVWLGPRWGS